MADVSLADKDDYSMLADDLAMAILVSSNDGYLSNFAIGSLKFPFCSKWPLLLIWRILFVNLEDPFLSEIRKTSVRLVVPFAKNTTHPMTKLDLSILPYQK